MDKKQTYTEWYNSKVNNDWRVVFRPKQDNGTPGYFENFTGNVYIQFPQENHPDHVYHMINGDFIGWSSGKIKDFESKKIEIKSAKTHVFKPGDSRRKCLNAKLVMYDRWQKQVSPNTLFSQISPKSEWHELYKTLTTDNCKVGFTGDDSMYLGALSGRVHISSYDKKTLVIHYYLSLKNGDFSYCDARNEYIDCVFEGGFPIEQDCPESKSLDVKLALLKYWQEKIIYL